MSTIVAQTLSNGTVSTSTANCIQGSAKAWVNFNGTGTVAIRASYNVSSITDNGAGDYTVNFTNALTDANYSVGGSARSSNDAGEVTLFQLSSQASFSVSSVRVRVVFPTVAYIDSNTVCVQVFR